jgi:hypothetical protein
VEIYVIFGTFSIFQTSVCNIRLKKIIKSDFAVACIILFFLCSVTSVMTRAYLIGDFEMQIWVTISRS